MCVCVIEAPGGMAFMGVENTTPRSLTRLFQSHPNTNTKTSPGRSPACSHSHPPKINQHEHSTRTAGPTRTPRRSWSASSGSAPASPASTWRGPSSPWSPAPSASKYVFWGGDGTGARLLPLVVVAAAYAQQQLAFRQTPHQNTHRISRTGPRWRRTITGPSAAARKRLVRACAWFCCAPLHHSGCV